MIEAAQHALSLHCTMDCGVGFRAGGAGLLLHAKAGSALIYTASYDLCLVVDENHNQGFEGAPRQCRNVIPNQVLKLGLTRTLVRDLNF